MAGNPGLPPTPGLLISFILLILHKHLYRTSNAEDEDKPAITIPFSMLRDVINAHEKQQSFIDADVSCNKKRPRDEENSDDDSDSNGEDLLEEILRLKKPRVANN